MVSFGAEMRIR